jgi:hypothetical protein
MNGLGSGFAYYACRNSFLSCPSATGIEGQRLKSWPIHQMHFLVTTRPTVFRAMFRGDFSKP